MPPQVLPESSFPAAGPGSPRRSPRDRLRPPMLARGVCIAPNPPSRRACASNTSRKVLQAAPPCPSSSSTLAPGMIRSIVRRAPSTAASLLASSPAPAPRSIGRARGRARMAETSARGRRRFRATRRRATAAGARARREGSRSRAATRRSGAPWSRRLASATTRSDRASGSDEVRRAGSTQAARAGSASTAARRRRRRASTASREDGSRRHASCHVGAGGARHDGGESGAELACGTAMATPRRQW